MVELHLITVGIVEREWVYDQSRTITLICKELAFDKKCVLFSKLVSSFSVRRYDCSSLRSMMEDLVIITNPPDDARGDSEEGSKLVLSTSGLEAIPRLGIIEPPTPGVNSPLSPLPGSYIHANPISNATSALQIPSLSTAPSTTPRTTPSTTSSTASSTAPSTKSTEREAIERGATTKESGDPSPVSRSSSKERSHRRTSSHEVKETLNAFSTNCDGMRTVNQYLLKGLIGKGGYARVELATDRETGISYVRSFFLLSLLLSKFDTDPKRHDRRSRSFRNRVSGR